MKAHVLLALAASLFAGCSRNSTAPTPVTVTAAPTPVAPVGTTSAWTANSVVLSVSDTRNSCLADNTVGQTMTNVGWTINEHDTSIGFLEAIGPDFRMPYYTGSLSANQFTATTWQDGGFDCFVWGGDLSGSFSADGLTFDAIENIEYRHTGESPMQVRRHWTGTKR